MEKEEVKEETKKGKEDLKAEKMPKEKPKQKRTPRKPNQVFIGKKATAWELIGSVFEKFTVGGYKTVELLSRGIASNGMSLEVLERLKSRLTEESLIKLKNVTIESYTEEIQVESKKIVKMTCLKITLEVEQ